MLGDSGLRDAVAHSSASWPSYRPVPSLDDEVHVLRLSVQQEPAVLSRLETFLSQREIERADSFRFPADRERHVVARGGLRAVLGRHLAAAPGDLRFRSNGYGKPVLYGPAGHNALRFNLSHSGAFVLLAVARRRRVGVDIEEIREDVPYLEMAQRFFSAAEHAALRAQPSDHRIPFFFATWTRKEAYVKGRGQGLSIPSQAFTVDVAGQEPRPVDDRGRVSRPGSWRVAGVDAAAGYAAALAVENGDWNVRCFDADEVVAAMPADW